MCVNIFLSVTPITMTLSSYLQLKQQIVLSVGSSDNPNLILTQILERYKHEINSPRRYEQIKTVGQLLLTLEIRDILSENHVEPLRRIAQKVTNSRELLTNINEYANNHVPVACINYYAQKNLKQSTSNKILLLDVTDKNPYTCLSPNKTEKIHQTIVEQIGVFWRDLARNLKISEHKIDEIDKSCNTLYSKASKLLELCYDNQMTDPQRWLLVLCGALERARRKDLSRTIHEIATMNI